MCCTIQGNCSPAMPLATRPSQAACDGSDCSDTPKAAPQAPGELSDTFEQGDSVVPPPSITIDSANVAPASPKTLAKGATLEAVFAPGASQLNGQKWVYWVRVQEPLMRQELPHYKGPAKPFIMVPVAVKNGTPQWLRVDMQPRQDLSNPNETVFISGNIFNAAEFEDPKLVKQFGIKLFLQTNVGTFQLPSQHQVTGN